MATEQIIVEYVALVDGMKAQLKTVQAESKAVEKSAVDAGNAVTESFKKSETSAISLKTQLRNLKAELAVATDPKDVERLARAAGEVANKIDDASKAARIFSSESKFEQIRNALGGIGRNILSLNFKQAAQDSKLLVSAVKSLSFKDVIGTVKDLGTTLFNLGKSLLFNPLFIIPGLIIAIGAALIALKDKIPFVTKALDFVGDSVKKIKNFVTGITDAIGLTTVATDNAFDKLIAKGKEVDRVRAERAKFQQGEADKAKKIADEREKELEDERNRRKKVLDIELDYFEKVNKAREDNSKKLKEEQDKEDKVISDSMDARLKSNLDFLEKSKKAEEDKAKKTIEEEKEADEEKKKQKEEVEAALFELASESVNAIFEHQNDLAQQKEQQDQAQADADILRVQALVDNKTLTEQQGASQIKAINDTLTAKKKEAAIAQAKRDRDQALFNIAIGTASAIVQALPNIPLSIIIGIIGAIQAGVVLSKPPPKFAKGVIDLKGGVQGRDSIPSLLMPGESVMTTQETLRHKDLLQSIRNDSLDKYLLEKYINPKVSDIINSSTANNMAESIKLNSKFPDEYALGRVMRRNKEVEIGNADYLASKNASELIKKSYKGLWS